MIRRPPRSTRTDTLFPYTTLFKASGTGTALIKAIDVIRDANTRKSRDLPDGVPLPFPNRQWKRLITESGRIDRRRYEIAIRSEEHTSELQSLMRISYAVFCLKKKKKNNTKLSSQ